MEKPLPQSALRLSQVPLDCEHLKGQGHPGLIHNTNPSIWPKAWGTGGPQWCLLNEYINYLKNITSLNADKMIYITLSEAQLN